jgi:hypothetical protein
MRSADVIEGRNGVLILPRGEYGLPQAVKLIRHHFERMKPRIVRQSARAPRSARPRRVSRRATRAGSSRDGPSEPSEPSEPHIGRPLTAAERRFLKTEVDRRRREILAARPEVTPEAYRLFDEDRA